MPVTISIVMPVLKELGNLEGAINYVTESMQSLVEQKKVSNWEIIIVDSLDQTGQSDGTPELADFLSKKYPLHVKVIHNEKYVNLGLKYRQALAKASFDYFMLVPGKNTLHGDSLQNLLSNVPDRGMVIGYQASMNQRPLRRRLISKAFRTFMNFVFKLNLRYYNGVTVIPTHLLRKLNPQVDDFAYMAEILVTLLKKYRIPFIEAPFLTRGRRIYGKTDATSWHNIKSVALTVIKLIKKVYFNNGQTQN